MPETYNGWGNNGWVNKKGGGGGTIPTPTSSSYGPMPTYQAPPPINFQSQRNPDIAAAQGKANDYYNSLDPKQQRIEAMAAARDLGVGMTREARANEARRGVLGTGVSSFNDRQIGSDVMRQSLQAGLAGARSGQEMQGGAIGQIGSLATAQASNQQADLTRLAQQYQMQQQLAMDKYRADMEARSLELQQKAQEQQSMLNMLNAWSQFQDKFSW
jgi:hypothetical protein